MWIGTEGGGVFHYDGEVLQTVEELFDSQQFILGPRVERLEKAPLRGGSGGESTIYFDVVPGVPAFIGAAARLGAPIMHDFCAISLSDLLTPWELIEERLSLAAKGDFVVSLYNPRSKKRDWQLARALEILGGHRSANTPVGLVKRAMRDGESVSVHKLVDFPVEEVDMESMVIVGNSNTFLVGPFMVTPRGYSNKYCLEKR